MVNQTIWSIVNSILWLSNLKTYFIDEKYANIDCILNLTWNYSTFIMRMNFIENVYVLNYIEVTKKNEIQNW